jgi:ribA/ribD-fused uncharacterized protein
MLFRDKFYFLSNMYPCTIKLGKYTFKCAEAAFQAAKCPQRINEFVNLNGFEAKKLGRTVQLRPDWNEKRLYFMEKIIRAKFNQNPDLAKRLCYISVHTPIVEDNTWNDTFWGVCNGKGENHLGKILMQVRLELKIEACKRCSEHEGFKGPRWACIHFCMEAATEEAIKTCDGYNDWCERNDK